MLVGISAAKERRKFDNLGKTEEAARNRGWGTRWELSWGKDGAANLASLTSSEDFDILRIRMTMCHPPTLGRGSQNWKRDFFGRERRKESAVVQFDMLGKTKGSQPCGQDEHLRGNGGDGSRGQGGHK